MVINFDMGKKLCCFSFNQKQQFKWTNFAVIFSLEENAFSYCAFVEKTDCSLIRKSNMSSRDKGKKDTRIEKKYVIFARQNFCHVETWVKVNIHA